MKKIKKVLIALDYDLSAKQVAEQGFSMAKNMGADVILLHVITDMVWPPNKAQSPLLRIKAKPLLSTPLSKIFLDNYVSTATIYSLAWSRSTSRVRSSSNSCLRV